MRTALPQKERLEGLRLRGELTWPAVADIVGVTVSMIHLVRKGKRKLSDKALYRLAKAENEHGLAPITKEALESEMGPAIRFWNTVDELERQALYYRKQAAECIGYAEQFEKLAAEAKIRLQKSEVGNWQQPEKK